MKLRSIALAGVALAALSASPALANDTQGWYIGLGAGYDHQDPVHVITAPPLSAHANVGMQDMAMVAGAFGYKWASGLRLEFEVGYSSHDVHAHNPPFAGTLSGTGTLKSALFNIVYDMNLGGRWGLSLGGGFGAGAYNMSITDSFFPALKLIRGQHTEFMWQGILGLEYQTGDHSELFLDYRYRSAELDHGYASDFLALTPIHVAQAQEHVAMVGFRWYLDTPEPIVVPPATCATDPHLCPPPPPPPIITKTFIVFFDFDKSNLTEPNLAIVEEAVRTAKANGFVKVLVTGHTDTVGSDSYNMALSIRRAQTVKDEMVREGMDGGGIEIVGKSFHDLRNPTGPGVKDDQNRRAVIDLGG
jgi:OOP family OmpA-OmpF porin